MELWIRSQPKGWLGKVENLRKMRTAEGWNIIANDNTYIGTYNTKERALEVLDDIQNMLRFFKAEGFTGEGLISIENNLAIYQMPKE